MSQLKYDCPRLVLALAGRGGKIMEIGTSQDFSNIAFGLADLGYFNEEIFGKIGKHANVLVGGTLAICNTLWAFGISGLIAKHEKTVRMLWNEAMKRQVSEFQDGEWSQLEIARLFARSEGVHLKVVDDDGGGRSKRNMIERAAANVDNNPPSSFERDIANDLKRFGFSGFKTEISPFDNREGGNLLKIDIAWKKEKVALELDGPSHFLSPSNERDGPTKAKNRLLKSLGWKVLNVSYMLHKKYEKLSDEKKKKNLVAWLKKLGVKPKT